MKVDLRRATFQEIYDLRFSVLGRGRDPRQMQFPGDQTESTRHYGAFIDSLNVCCLTLMSSEFEGKPALQLRGMATHPDYQRQGIGARLVAAIEADIQPRPATLWCNARTEAVGFYQQQGWKIVSEEFVIAGVGPHFKMRKDIA